MTQVGLTALSGKSIMWAVLHILLGVGTIVVAVLDSRDVTLILGWLFLLIGAFLFLQVIQSKRESHIGWKVLVAFLYEIFGFYLSNNRHPNVNALTLVLMIFFLAEGVIGVVGYFHGRKLAGAG
jgi:uncharacterized membrane protein HdeD (DUF308 family)